MVTQVPHVRACATPRPLRAFRAEYSKVPPGRGRCCTGSTVEWLAPDVLGVPWWRVC